MTCAEQPRTDVLGLGLSPFKSRCVTRGRSGNDGSCCSLVTRRNIPARGGPAIFADILSAAVAARSAVATPLP